MTEPTATPTTAFVLAGGGTKGAFEVGVLRHLVQVAGIRPSIITATSAGAIIGAKLAQARSPEEFTERTDELCRDLLAMTDQSAVFAKQPWLADFDGTPLGVAVDGFITKRPPRPDQLDQAPAVTATPDRSHHRRRSMHSLHEALATLPSLRHARSDLPGHASSLLTLDPLGDALRGDGHGAAGAIAPLDPALVGRPGLQLRLAVTALEAGTVRYVTESGAVVEADATTPCTETPDPIGVVEGVLTSASVPMVFAPRRLGGATYVDGGVCQNVPVRAAVRLGAERIVAVLAVPLEPAPDLATDYGQANFITVYMRAAGQVAFIDRQQENIDPPLPDGAELLVIEPTVDLVGPFEVNEGLMLVDMDYGALRAAEALADLTDAQRATAMRLTDTAIVARDRAWYLEEDLWASEHGAGIDLTEVRAAKAAVRDALSERSALGLAPPPEAEAWWLDWERHAADRPPHLPERP